MKDHKGKKNYYEFKRVRNEEETEEEVTKSSFETLLEEVKSEGRYQKLLIVCFMIPLATLNSIGSSDTNLLLTTPSHTCHVPRSSLVNVTEEEWKNVTIPWERNSLGDMVRSSCLMYNVSDNVFFINSEDLQKNTSFSEREIKGCEYGWDFDASNWEETPITQFGWVCHDKYIATSIFSLTFTGNAVGTLLFSIVSDKYGRKPTFFFVLLLQATASLVLSFAPTFTVFAITKFLIALCYYSFFQLAYVIVIELCGERLRTFAACSSFIACVLGNCLMSLVAYIVRNWKTFVLCCHLPSLIFLLYWKLLPESPRWLLSRSRVSECEKILIEAARINGREFSERSKKLLMEAEKEEKKKISLRSIMASFLLAKHLLLTSLILSIGYILYSGMLLNIHNMTGSKILNYFILSMVEIPGNVIGSMAAQYVGRRLSSMIFTLLSSVCSIASLFVLKDGVALGILCALNKMFAGALVLVVYMQIGELFPTRMRATAYGITGILSIAAVIFVPPLIAMGGSYVFLPYYILFGIGLFGLLVSTFLPETVGRPLPQTTEEAVLIGKNQPYFSVIHKWNAHLYSTNPRPVVKKFSKIRESSLS